MEDDAEGVGAGFELGRREAGGPAILDNSSGAGSELLDEPDKEKSVGDGFVSGDGVVLDLQIRDGEAGWKRARVPDLQGMVENPNLDIAGRGVVPVANGIDDGFPDGVERIFPFFFPPRASRDSGAHADVPFHEGHGLFDLVEKVSFNRF